MPNRFNPPCNCCGCTIISSEISTYVYAPAEVLCFKRFREILSVRTLITQQTTTWASGVASDSVVTISDETVATDATTDSVTTDLRAGRFEWIFPQVTVPFGSLVVESETGTPGANGTRTFQPRTQTTTDKTAREEYRLALRFDVSGQDNFGRLDAANVAFIQSATATLTGAIYRIDGFGGLLGITTQVTAKWLYSNAETPVDANDFDSLWAAGSGGTATVSTNANSFNVLSSLPVVQTDSLYLLLFSDADRRGINLSDVLITLTAKDWIRKYFELVGATDAESKAWNGLIASGRQIRSKAKLPDDCYQADLEFVTVGTHEIRSMSVETQHATVTRSQTATGTLYFHAVETLAAATSLDYFTNRGLITSVEPTVTAARPETAIRIILNVASGVAWTYRVIGSVIDNTAVIGWRNFEVIGGQQPLITTANTAVAALTGEDSLGEKSPIVITNNSPSAIAISGANVFKIRSLVYIDDPDTEEDETGDRRLTFIPVFPDSNIKNAKCGQVFPACYDPELELSIPSLTASGRGMIKVEHPSTRTGCRATYESIAVEPPRVPTEIEQLVLWDAVAPDFVLPPQSDVVIASGSTNETSWTISLQEFATSGWIDQDLPVDNRANANSALSFLGAVTTQRLQTLEHSIPGDDESPLVYPWLVTIPVFISWVVYQRIRNARGITRWTNNFGGVSTDSIGQRFTNPDDLLFGKRIISQNFTPIAIKFYSKPPAVIERTLVESLSRPLFQHQSTIAGEYWFQYVWSNGTVRYSRWSKDFIDAQGGPVAWVTNALNANPNIGDSETPFTARRSYYTTQSGSISDGGPIHLRIEY
jgi:hypothetical protein